MCAYDALRITWEEREHRVPRAERGFGAECRTPLFIGADGHSAWTSADSRRLAKAMVAAIGLDPEEFG
eukprot:2264212-Pleurochrysis_carterae.AAC.1